MRSRILWLVVIATIAASGSAAVLQSQSPPSGVVLDAEARVHKDLAVLASPRLEGRRAGTPGADTAANFIARRFLELGLRAAFRTSECDEKGDCRPASLQAFSIPDYVTTNIGAIVPGTDSALRNEFVAVTAHYDHIGRRSRGDGESARPSIYPGADDNASGTAAVLELARRFGERPLRRSVILRAFGAEEFGLVGSGVFVENPPFDLHEIKVALNLDMVGRLRKDRLEIFGAGDKLTGILESANSDTSFSLMVKPASSRSDDFTFLSHQIPALRFTAGDHVDYHRPSDTVDRLNVAGASEICHVPSRKSKSCDPSCESGAGLGGGWAGSRTAGAA